MTASLPTLCDETILVVDDEHSVREVIRFTLEAEGYCVLEARDGERALDGVAIYAKQIDLIITDGRMPVMGGLQLIETYQRWYPGLRCLVVSGYADVAASLEALPGSPIAFLSKPFTPKELTNAVRDVLDRPPDASALREPRRSMALVDSAAVTANDGTSFYCHVATAGSRGTRMWIYETSTTRYVGPPYLGPMPLEKIRDAVNTWWYLKKVSE